MFISRKAISPSVLALDSVLTIVLIKFADLTGMITLGQAYGTFAVALGYGRWRAGKIGNGVGVPG